MFGFCQFYHFGIKDREEKLNVPITDSCYHARHCDRSSHTRHHTQSNPVTKLLLTLLTNEETQIEGMNNLSKIIEIERGNAEIWNQALYFMSTIGSFVVQVDVSCLENYVMWSTMEKRKHQDSIDLNSDLSSVGD